MIEQRQKTKSIDIQITKANAIIWIHCVAFILLFFTIFYHNISIQQKPNINYKELTTGEWLITDDFHESLKKGSIVTALSVDGKTNILSESHLWESLYDRQSNNYRERVLEVERFFYDASQKINKSEVYAIDSYENSHKIIINEYTLSDLNVSSIVLYIVGWLIFICALATAHIGIFDTNRLIFLSASTLVGIACFINIENLERVWAISPDELHYRSLIVHFIFRLNFLSMIVIWLRAPNNILSVSVFAKITVAFMSTWLIGSWAIYFFVSSHNYDSYIIMPLFVSIFVGYVCLYHQWNVTHQRQNFYMSSSIALKCTLVFVVSGGLINLSYNIVLLFEVLNDDHAFLFNSIKFFLFSLGIATIILHEHLYKINKWWWHIGGVFFALSIGFGKFIVLSNTSLGFSATSLILSTFTAFLSYMLIMYYLKMRYAKSESQLLTIAVPKIIQINTENLSTSSVNDIWKNILVNIFRPKKIYLIDQKNMAMQYRKTLEKEFVSINNAGEAMYIQAVGNNALALRFASDGLKLFTHQDMQQATILWQMVNQAYRANQAYSIGEQTERKRIAADLHDDIGGKLLYLSSQIGEYGTYARQTLSDLRMLTHGLSNENSTLESIFAEVRYHSHQFCEAKDIAINFESNIDESVAELKLSPQASVNIICIVTELIRNALQHDNTKTIWLTANINQIDCFLEVINDGDETNPDNWVSGLGTVSINRRIHQLKGEIQWISKKGGGAECKASWKTTDIFTKSNLL